MALNASGPISLGGSTAGESIALELGLSATGQISLNDAAVRDLAGVASGAIVMPTDFYGKSDIPSGALYFTGTQAFGASGLNVLQPVVSSPTQVTSLTNWVNVSSTVYSVAALTKSGELWTWGRNNYGRLGQNSTNNISSPTQVGALTDWSSACFNNATLTATRSNGTLWSTGSFYVNALNGITVSSPTQVGALTNWAVAQRGFQDRSACIKTDGTLWMWGSNGYGGMGQNVGYSTTGKFSSPVQVGALTGWTKATAGSCTVGIESGRLFTWGLSNIGDAVFQNTRNVDNSSPIQVGAVTTWTDVCGGPRGTIALRNNGTIWTWGGLNTTGFLGHNNTLSASSPTQVGALTNWAQIGTSGNNGIEAFGAVKTDGTLWVWGSNAQKKLKDVATANFSIPIQVGSSTDWILMSDCRGAPVWAIEK